MKKVLLVLMVVLMSSGVLAYDQFIYICYENKIWLDQCNGNICSEDQIPLGTCTCKSSEGNQITLNQRNDASGKSSVCAGSVGTCTITPSSSIYIKNTATDKDGESEDDYCYNGRLAEHNCDSSGYFGFSWIDCPKGYSCSNGACVQGTLQDCTNPSAKHGKFKCVVENSVSKIYGCDNGEWVWENTCTYSEQCLSSLGDTAKLCGFQNCEENNKWVCEGNTKIYYQYNSDCVLSKSQSEQCSGTCKDGSCVEEKCTAGQTKTYLCPDGKQVNWCSCVNGEWSCIPSPESACSVECTSNSDCDKGYTCKDGQCEGGVPVFVWYIIGALVLIAGFIIYWFGSWRKK